ncbi:MAG: hypothetical protein ACRCUP_06085 [Mycoplasmatales bacterium]
MYKLYKKNKFLFLLVIAVISTKLMGVIGLATKYFFNFQIGFILDITVGVIIMLIIERIYEKKKKQWNIKQ